jgi:hypothetical protein
VNPSDLEAIHYENLENTEDYVWNKPKPVPTKPTAKASPVKASKVWSCSVRELTFGSGEVKTCEWK